jgi:hypothetical protein
VDVEPRRLDVADDLVLRDPLPVTHRRDDVPVTERDVAVCDRQRPRAVEMNDTAADRVHRRAVRCRDVDPEVER